MANQDSNVPQQGGTKLDTNFPDGVGKPSDDQPNLPNPQPVKVPGSITPRRKK